MMKPRAITDVLAEERCHPMPDHEYLLSSYDYRLPQELIAQRAAEPRDSSRLMVSNADGSIDHRIFPDLPVFLEKGDVLVINESRVIPARMYGRKPTGGKVEILLISREEDDGSAGTVGTVDTIGAAGTIGEAGAIGTGPGPKPNESGAAAISDGKETWSCMLKGKRLGPGIVIELPGGASCRILEKRAGHEDDILPRVEFNVPGESLEDYLERHGEMPLPPYIKTRLDDQDRYQTVYAHPGKKGSVAAPTAGLHFTEELLDSIRDTGVHIAKVTLHVSIGTFRPVRAEDVREHRMDEEYCMLDGKNAAVINHALEGGGRLFPVGTTTVKTLETVLRKTGAPAHGTAGGASEHEKGFPRFKPWAGASDLFIYPPFEFLSPIKAMLTNFHLPKSTLLMLVSAFAGRERILDAYREAVAQRYRFFSFGDAMLIFR